MSQAPFNIQPTLETSQVIMAPLQEQDFEALYTVASDPEIWAQHPNKDRWQKPVFKTFFEGAIQSQGGFKIIDKTSHKIIGSTRIYDYDAASSCILIGYTFYSRSAWGKGINHAVKRLMLDYLFQFVSKIHFHIGAENKRSQIAIERLGAIKIGEKNVTYFGELPKLNFVYEIQKTDWAKTSL